jgi:hypothetical protein
MKIIFIPVLLIIFTLHSFAQIIFEKGYIIDNNNQRIECLIKNNDWKDNPQQFEYKNSKDESIAKGDITTVKEFGISGIARFVKADVKIDISRMDGGNLSKQRDPEWEQRQLFLKVLVEGKAILYGYEDGPILRFFYSLSDSISQLVYKEFYLNSDEVATNNTFRNQLWTYVRCQSTSSDVSKLQEIRPGKILQTI